MKRRALVAGNDGDVTQFEPLDGKAQLRALRTEALGQFAPLLAAAAALSAIVIVATLWERVSHSALLGWTATTIACAWLMTRRLQDNAARYLRRTVPGRVVLENGAIVALTAILWSVVPVTLYARQANDIQTVIACTTCALMCGALAIATAPIAALLWAGALTIAIEAAVWASGDRFRFAMMLSVLLHFGFIAIVVRRIAVLACAQAHRLASQQTETDAAVRLMREYEERGTSSLWQTDGEHKLSYASPALASLLGRPVAQLVGVPLPALLGGSAALGSALLARSPFSGVEVEAEIGGDGRHALAFSGTPLTGPQGQFAGFRGSCTDVTETRSSERRFRQLASLDVLTELPNRTRMRELLGEALLQARASGTPCGILMLDLDGFKPVNDTFGHPKGDQVLKAVASRLVAALGDRGIVGRLGGDEFAIVLHDAPNQRVIRDLGEALIAAVSEPYPVDTVSVRIGLSVGSAFGPIDGDTVDDLVKKADLALYEAKAQGRGTYRHFEQSMQTEADDRLKLEHDLRQALPLNQLRLYYQPLIHSQTQEVVGFEALLRWQHPVRGFVSPATFVPLAEEVGLIHEIGEWVMRTAARDCARWPAPISVAVNLSPVQLQSPHVPAMVSDALARARLPANRLEVEVTEGVFMGDSDGAIDVLRRLRALGVRIALDDFGTGYSSLGYLNRTIFNKLKIDGSFVRGAATRPETISIIQAIVTLANCFQMTITAEGVETQDDYKRMASLGCHQMQGYLFGRPVPFERATAVVGNRWSEADRLARA